MKNPYDLRCARHGNQVHFRETGQDRDGVMQVEVWPCDECEKKWSINPSLGEALDSAIRRIDHEKKA